MEKMLLLGDEALAQGAIDAGMSGMYAYPGTPSTEIMEYVQRSSAAKERNIHRKWSANEKTAAESALGMSYAGKRSMCAMKHVGLNVAADCFMNSAITGANGGTILTVADDPSMHSSQNEQDSRFYGKFAMVPVFEPSNQQECYDMAFHAFDISEKYQVPILLRLTTRLSHSRSGVAARSTLKENELKLPEDKRQFVLLPAIARKRYRMLLANQEKFEFESENSPFNSYIDGSDKSVGIIACGIAFNYLMENYNDSVCPFPVLKISQYPLPRKQVEKIASECKKLIVLEEGAPIVEDMLKGYLGNCLKVSGRLDGTLPRDGELNPNLVAKAVSGKPFEIQPVPEIVTGRPPKFCNGCGHIDAYNALNEVMKEFGDGHVLADIGCYTLAALPPFSAINSCVDMGASITMAKGAADAGLFPSIAVIGDSTFTHSGMTGLLDAVIENTNMVVMILDNSTTGMTGGQDSHAVDRLVSICEGLGVHKDHIIRVIPLKKNHDEMVRIIRQEIAYKGVSVIIPTRECMQTLKRKTKANK
ncbi:MAG TPA: thiamine pyrophosphate-dependent enzyme [Clostridiales bacterium]|jgi:indolepyruvate ferredoxin oxidoreductase, alpha subunit|nr:thiamine pyrophosphate-dependent enzyme [Clostridiales bacterium]HQP70337.1 thiamine pyrophosphate-dependent enzyme [Clostridiales bacterium]